MSKRSTKVGKPSATVGQDLEILSNANHFTTLMQSHLVHYLEFSISLRLWHCQCTVFVSLSATDHFKQRLFRHPRTLILSCHGDDAKSLLFGDLRLEAEVNHGILEHEAVG